MEEITKIITDSKSITPLEIDFLERSGFVSSKISNEGLIFLERKKMRAW